MASTTAPVIFSPARRRALRQRMLRLQHQHDAPRYLIADMVDDVLDRLSFLRVEPKTALVIGDWTRNLTFPQANLTRAEPADGFDEEHPFPFAGFDFIASLGTLDTVNDLPGALVHIRNALAPGGLMIASFLGAGSLPQLRTAMFAADGDRPAPRIHPQIDVRAGGQLLQRTGYADPVIDSRSLDVSFRSLDRLIGDLRAQGLANVLARPGPPLGKAALHRARDTFGAAHEHGRTTERFEIITLSGWKR
jgi:SAM-dependent methyltransferase